MLKLQHPSDENGRLLCLRTLEILDTPPDPALDAITHALAVCLEVPIALVSLVDHHRQWFKSRHGLDIRESSRDISFCAHAIQEDDALVVPDATLDPRFADNPLVTGRAQMRFYAGVPLRVDGHALGTLCVIDRRPRDLGAPQLALLQRMAGAAEACLVRDSQHRRLAISEARLHDFARAASDLLWECNAGLDLTWVSPGDATALFASAARWVGSPLWDGVLLDALGRPDPGRRTLYDALARGEPVVRLAIEVALGGASRVLSFSAMPVRNADGAVIGWRGGARDITETVQAARALREQDERLRRIAHQLPGLVFQVERSADGNVRIPYVSDGVKDLFGVDAAAAQDDPRQVLRRVHADDRPRLVEAMTESARSGDALHVEFRIAAGQPRTRWALVHATPLWSLQGHVVWYGYVHDATEQRAAAAALDDARQRLVLAVEAARLGVVQVDLDARRIEFDALAALEHGYPAGTGAMPIADWFESVDEADGPALDGALAGALRDGSVARASYRVRPTLREGLPPRRIELLLARHQDAGSLVGLCRDVTQQEQAERALRESEDMRLRHEEQVRFLARVGHELRTPMSAVLGFVQLLRDDPVGALGPHQRRWLDQIRHGGRHLVALIDDIVALAAAGELPARLKPVPLPLAPAIDAAAALLAPLARNAEVSVHIDARPDAVATGDERALHQVLLNVIGNAIKYNRRGGRVRIRALSGHDRCLIEVRDDGPGIAPENLKRMFRPFERLGASASAVDGTGLGLSIAKALIEAQGGTIEADCPEGGGTRIRVMLPRAVVEPAAWTGATRPAALHDSETPTVPNALGQRRLKAVYVEDNPVNAALLADVFERRPDWRLTVFDSGFDSIEDRIRREAPDLLLLDLNLPRLSGLELLQRLRDDERTRSIRSIAISADATRETIQRALEAGFLAYWTKPIDLSEIEHWLDALALRLQPETGA